MTFQDQVALGSEEQLEAFENAEAAVQNDYEKGVVDGREWGGELPNGEVVRILAEAYTGTLEVEPQDSAGE